METPHSYAYARRVQARSRPLNFDCKNKKRSQLAAACGDLFSLNQKNSADYPLPLVENFERNGKLRHAKRIRGVLILLKANHDGSVS